jgi:ATP/maltotriose-dependent transcriptional regulator MalT
VRATLRRDAQIVRPAPTGVVYVCASGGIELHLELRAREKGGIALPMSDESGRGPVLQATKLHPPALRDGTVRRARLTRTLVSERPSLALVVAPPGFGKTSLLADWAAIDPRPFAWVAIDEQDNDRTVLWTYIGAALGLATGDTATAERLAALARDPDPAAAVLQALELPETGIVLVLDDYHLIESDACHQTAMRLIELAPDTLQLAISSRTDPPLPIARLRATERLTELRSDDLQFTSDETATLVNTSLGLGLAAGSVARLHERTDGWPAGLYLAYLSMRTADNRDAFVETFGGSNRHVYDYLTEQVLTSLEPDTLEFMLTTSIVDRISGPLADAITEQSGSAQRLIALERANVFIAPLDDRREFYRYHPLLADLLQAELLRREPRRGPGLHRRAAAWYDRAGDADRAVRHAIRADDIDLAADVVGRNYLQEIQWGRMATLTGWLDALGPDAVQEDRRLGVVKAWTMHFLGRHAEGDAALAAARRASGRGALPDGASSIEATGALIGAAFPGGDVGKMLASARRAFALEGNRNSPWRVTVHVQLGFALVRAGQYAEALGPLRTAIELATSSELWMDAVGSRSLFARAELEVGDPANAEAVAREAIGLGELHGLGQTPTHAYARGTLGTVLVRRGMVEAGERWLAQALPGVRVLDEPLAVAEVLLAMAEARQVRGRPREAAMLLREVDEIMERSADPGALRTTRDALASRPTPVPAEREQLSAREIEVLAVLAEGLSKRQAADRLFLSFNTVHSHVRAIYRKLDVSSRAEALMRAREAGLIE